MVPLIAFDRPMTTTKLAALNSRCMISGGKVMRLPTEKPNTPQAASTTGTLSVCRMVRSAAAWLTREAAVTSRGSNRSTTMPRPRRPTIAMNVMTETANPALARPIFGSSNAIWCTMKPT